MVCLFCNEISRENKKLPLNIFNNKTFRYCSCSGCGLLFIDPIPSTEDLLLMYPAEYQQGINKVLDDPFEKQPGLRHPYRKIFDFFKQKQGKAAIVDFGCGNGKFVWNAINAGFMVDGVEFSQEQVTKLSQEINDSEFYTIDNFFKSHKKYDIIFMSNVLEHFTQPNIEFKRLIEKLNLEGEVIIEGPLEKNKGLVNFCKWKYFEFRLKMNPNYCTSFSPVHIFYSNYKNQLAFFERHGLKTKKFETIENSWPYPNSTREIHSTGDFFKFVIAKLSKTLGFFSSKYGNTFIYVGEKK